MTQETQAALTIHRQQTTLTEPERQTIFKLAETVIQSGLAPRKFNGNPAAAFICMLYGRDLGLSEVQAIKDVNVINGIPSISANLMVSRIRQYSPNSLFKVLESNGQRCRIEVAVDRDRDDPDIVEYTIDEAREAGLLSKDVWKKHPADMLFARCVSRVYRRYFAHLSAGIVYTPDEADEASATEPVPMAQAEPETMTATAAPGVKPMPRRGESEVVEEAKAEPAPETTTAPAPETETIIEEKKEPAQAGEGELDESDPLVVGQGQLEIKEDKPPLPDGLTQKDMDLLTDFQLVCYDCNTQDGLEFKYDEFREGNKNNKPLLLEGYKIFKTRMNVIENGG